jgi:hypothetical protein
MCGCIVAEICGLVGISILCVMTLWALASEFVFCNFCWVKREANNVAHTLAKFVLPQNLHVFLFP